MFLIAAALAASSPTAAQPAPAADAMVGADVDQVAKVLTDEGYKAKIETDEDGDRYIKSASGGRNFTIYVLGCGGGVKKGPCNGVGPSGRTRKHSWIDRVAGLLEKSPWQDTDPIASSSSVRSRRSF
jgi:hypothetical protein